MASNGTVLSQADLNSMNRGKKRQLNIKEWRSRKNKQLKDSGLEYHVTKGVHKGEFRPAKEPPSGESLCKCAKTGCKLDHESQVKLFEGFYNMDSKNQNRYLADHIDLQKPTERKVDHLQSRKEFTYTYWVKINGIRHKLCKKMFMNIFKVTETRLRTIKEKLAEGRQCFDDGRGRTVGVHPGIISDEIKDAIRQHIFSFPMRESHYSRKDAPERLYLDAGLTVSRMHANFNEKRQRQQTPTCTVRTYRDIFNSLNVQIGNPVSDSCGYCDEVYAKISRETSVIRKSKLREEHEKHLKLAADARIYHAKDSTDPSKGNFSITTDMEKVLFVPQLTCCDEYFKRTLSTFNLGIHDTGNSDASMYLWDETIANHASQDVISCLWKHVTKQFVVLEADETRNFIIWSDRCIGQFNNGYMVLFLKFLVDQNYFTQVEHKFFCTGHSYMSCDRDFGHVERRFRELKPVVPDDLEEVIKTARVQNPFKVTRMTQEDFMNFTNLAEHVRLPPNLKVTKYLCFKYEKLRPNIIFAKSTHDEQEWNSFPLKSKKKNASQVPSFYQFPLKQTHNAPLQIKKEKALDLRSLMEKITDEQKYQYFNKLTEFAAKK